MQKLIKTFLVICAVCLVAAVTGCRGEGPSRPARAAEESSGIGEENTHLWIWFDGGSPRRADSLEEIPPTDKLPWTLQTRIAAIILDEDRAVCAVNGWGFLVADNLSGPGVELKTVYDRGVLEGRTIGSVFPQSSQIYCQVYKDSVLSPGGGPRPAESSPAALAAFDPDAAGIRLIPIPFQHRNPAWEAVSLVPRDEETWHLAWKNREDDATEFRYTRFDTTAWKETEIGEREFLEQMKPLDGERGPEPLKLLIQRISRNVGAGGALEEVVFDVRLSRQFPYPPVQYRYGDDDSLRRGSAELFTLDAYAADGRIFLLFGSTVYWYSDGRQGLIGLPELPDDFTYTRFCTDGREFILAAWEEQDFVMVGSSGLVYTELPGGIPD